MNAGSVGSGLWSTQAALFPHLVQGWHGMHGELADVRRDIAIVLTPLKAVTVEEYDAPPPAVPAALMAAGTLSSTSMQTFGAQSMTGSLGLPWKISPPRNTEVVVSGSGTPGNMGASVIINGLDAWGRALSETITGTSGGAGTYSGVKCFAQVTSIVVAAGTGALAQFSVGTGIVIGLSQYPKTRTGIYLPLIQREMVDAALLSSPTGALTLPATNPPFGAYTPSTAPTTAAPAVVTGSVNLNAGGTYGATGTLSDSGANDLILKMTVNGALNSITLNGTTNVASQAAFLAAIDAAWPGLTATINGSGFLVLTNKLSGAGYGIVIPSDSTNTAYAVVGVGGTGGSTTDGTGHSYAIDYEFDGTKQPTYSAIGMPGPIVPPPGSNSPTV
jgi:hypothetical protein